ncbi:C-4 sterol methyl oxidase [Orbilia oligospora]|nr:C-4 sterol methyl oxidase [Orbilia oligospora]
MLTSQKTKSRSNSTFVPDGATYWAHYDHISEINGSFNVFEKMWAAWYAWIADDVLATGIMSFVMHELVYFGRSLPWMICDAIPYFQRWKIQDQKIPNAAQQWRCIKSVLFTHLVIELPQIWLFHPLAKAAGMSTDVPFPAWTTMAFQIAIFFVLEDAWHYWLHRLFHWGPLYKNIHKIHHEHSAPFGLAAEYAHPVEVLTLGIGTVFIPIGYCWFAPDFHVMTMYIWICLRLFQAIDAHSGYDFPWSLHHFIPFWAGASHHDVHHEKFIGNYASSFRWWDYMLDTEAGPEAQQRRRDKKRAERDAKALAEQQRLSMESMGKDAAVMACQIAVEKKTS